MFLQRVEIRGDRRLVDSGQGPIQPRSCFWLMQADSHFWLSWPSAEAMVVQVNMLEAKSQLSRLVKAALAGEEVIIASHGKAQVTLVPCASAAGLKHPGGLAAASPELLASQVDAAFDAVVDQQVAELFNS